MHFYISLHFADTFDKQIWFGKFTYGRRLWPSGHRGAPGDEQTEGQVAFTGDKRINFLSGC